MAFKYTAPEEEGVEPLQPGATIDLATICRAFNLERQKPVHNVELNMVLNVIRIAQSFSYWLVYRRPGTEEYTFLRF